jgi:FkbM family methyltransferase
MIRQTKEGYFVIAEDQDRTTRVEQEARLDWDRDLIQFLGPYIREGSVAVDAGGSIGDTTIAFMEKVGPKGFVIAYEPCPEAYSCLSLNCTGANVKCYRLGLSDKECKMSLDIMNPTDLGTTFLCPKDSGSVNVTTLDDHYQYWPKEAREKRISLIKIDVEGMETHVLSGAEQVTRRDHPTLFVEIYTDTLERYGKTVQDVRNMLKFFGYSRFTLYPPMADWECRYFNCLAL